MQTRIYIEPGFGDIRILFYEDRMGKRYVAKPVELIFEECDDGALLAPTIRMNYHQSAEFLQSLADEIEKRGIRPSKVMPYESEMVAVKYHLEDMRKLVFKD